MFFFDFVGVSWLELISVCCVAGWLVLVGIGSCQCFSNILTVCLKQDVTYISLSLRAYTCILSWLVALVVVTPTVYEHECMYVCKLHQQTSLGHQTSITILAQYADCSTLCCFGGPTSLRCWAEIWRLCCRRASSAKGSGRPSKHTIDH